MPAETADVAIVGGGVSGLYSAWRLAYSGKPPGSIKVFEASGRLGGRLDTRTVPGTNCRVEFGAMRYPTYMAMVDSLLKQLGVPVEPFPNINVRHMYLRGKPVLMGPQGPLENAPYNLEGLESNNPFNLLVLALQRAVPDALSLSPSQWDARLATASYGGRPFWQWGFANLLTELISYEGYSYLDESLGIESAVANWNAALGLRTMSLLVQAFMNSKFMRPSAGWSDLPAKLQAALSTASNCQINMACKLQQVCATGDATYPIELHFAAMTGPRIVRAKQIVLAMPRFALEQIQVDPQLVPTDALAQKLAQVREFPAFRLYLAYETPWWQTYCGWKDGYSVTDLPLRQVFYGAGLDGPVADMQRIMMASYSDYRSVEFWSGFTHLFDAPGSHLLGAAPSPVQLHAESESVLIGPAERQLKQMHGFIGDLPKKTWIGYADWTVEGQGAAWHEWLPGINPMQAIKEMRHPFPNVPMYICGEAYSITQGWVEGAIGSAELMLQQNFQLSWPSWLQPGYDLGP
jgi:monoamine oxidase